MGTVPFEARGAWTALVTPFDAQGRFNSARFARLVEFQIEQGITGIVPCGTTGESPTLTWQEHDEAVGVAVDRAAGRAGVLAGTGSNNTAEAIRGTKDAYERGASAALLVDCYYNGPSSLELRNEYYQRVLDAVPEIPIVPYIIPGRSGCALAAEDLALLHLADPKRVPAVKQATGDLDRMRWDRELAGPTLAIMSGDDDITLAMMADPVIRCSGVISVMSNIVPRAISDMVAAQAAGEAGRAGEVAGKIRPILKLVVCKAHNTRTFPDGRTLEIEDRFRNPVPVKTMMAGLGMVSPLSRRPLGKMSRSAVALCREALRQIHRTAPEYLTPIDGAFEVDVAKRLEDDGVWAELAY
jgi:4-hydroxy-tetrahydrodipicolinate synthase